MIYTCSLDTPLGKGAATAENGSLTKFWFVGQKYCPIGVDARAHTPEYPVFDSLRTWLAAYFGGENPVWDLPLAPAGTPFQKAVWEILLLIPYGKVTTYGTVAQRTARGKSGSPLLARAVGGAVGHNPIAVIIPCHRVVGSTGSLTGYAGGIDRKKALLQLEQADFGSILRL
ncbi:MAG: methylated-DNA--[protein]-cysteine S-methyltransferase [Desulfovibrio sp.]|nr:methylated-DNA--[protein]-cysteine S-methyltransferase [Desulfovibrio sp.]